MKEKEYAKKCRKGTEEYKKEKQLERRRGMKRYSRIKKIYCHSKAYKWSEGHILNLKHAVFLSKVF
jgi:hypothetical protein